MFSAVRRKGFPPLSQTFQTNENTLRWARSIERRIDVKGSNNSDPSFFGLLTARFTGWHFNTSSGHGFNHWSIFSPIIDWLQSSGARMTDDLAQLSF